MKSRLLLRELFRDWYQGKLDMEDSVSFGMIVEANRRFLLDNHPLTLILLDEWASGYTLYEMSEKHSLHVGVTKNILKFAFELLGRKLEVSDGQVLYKVPPQLHPVARSVFNAYYETFTELPERDLEVI